MNGEPWPMTLSGVDRLQHAIRRIVWRAMPTIPGMTASPVTIAEIVTEALRELDAMSADYAARREEHVRVRAEAARLAAELEGYRREVAMLREDLGRYEAELAPLRAQRPRADFLDAVCFGEPVDRAQLVAYAQRLLAEEAP